MRSNLKARRINIALPKLSCLGRYRRPLSSDENTTVKSGLRAASHQMFDRGSFDQWSFCAHRPTA